MTDKITYSINEAVIALGVGRSTIYRHIDEGNLKALKVGGKRLIEKTEIHRWLDSYKEGDAK